MGIARTRLRPASLATWTDDRLMAFVRERDQLAFAEIFKRHHPAAYGLALRICGDRSLAEDAVQEAFLSLWRHCERYDEHRGNVRAWVLTIIHNRSVDILRRGPQDRLSMTDESIAERLESLENTEMEACSREQAREVRGALELLPAEQSCVIRLSYYGGFTQGEIASLLGTPVGTVKGRVRLGLGKLRVQFIGDVASA